MTFRLFDVGQPIQKYYGDNLENLYQQVMTYLQETYHNYKTNLPDIHLEAGTLAANQWGESAASWGAREISYGGHSWRHDGEGNVTHCDNVPIGKCVF